jgi:hypothetical protein
MQLEAEALLRAVAHGLGGPQRGGQAGGLGRAVQREQRQLGFLRGRQDAAGALRPPARADIDRVPAALGEGLERGDDGRHAQAGLFPHVREAAPVDAQLHRAAALRVQLDEGGGQGGHGAQIETLKHLVA